MYLPKSPDSVGGDQLRKAQQGDPQALAVLQEHFHPQLVRILRVRGASQIETEDVLADIWSDCVPGATCRLGLLSKFGGRFSLLSWLARVAFNRWIDRKRRSAKQVILEDSEIAVTQVCPTGLQDDQLQEILRASLRAAFDRCPGDLLLLLKLVYLQGLTQREAGNLFGWSEFKTSRSMSLALDQIKKRTLHELHRRDDRLELSWEDLLGLCEDDEDSFL